MPAPRLKVRQARTTCLKLSTDQKISFIASWIWRDDPESPAGNRVGPISPKVAVDARLGAVAEPGAVRLAGTVATGCPKLAWFSRSNASTRICQLTRSVILVFF